MSGEIHVRDRREAYFARVDIPIILSADLSTHEKMVYVALCAFASRENTCFPSVKALSDAASCSERQVFRCLDTLEKRGYIARSERYNERGQTSNSYDILGSGSMTESQAPAEKSKEKEECLTHSHPSPDSQSDGTRLNEPDKTYTPSECEGVPSPEPTSVRPGLERMASGDEPAPEEEIYSPEVLSAPMRETARLLLHETGRHKLTSGEVRAATLLASRHYPARVQQELRTAVERFRRRGRPLSELTLVYLEESLRHQKSLPGARTTAARRKAGEADPERARWDADLEEWERRQREAVAARFGGES